MSRDPEDGNAKDPASLHKYLYADGDPVNGWDPTGRAEIFENALIEGGSKLTKLEAFLQANAAQIRFVACLGAAVASVAKYINDPSHLNGASVLVVFVACLGAYGGTL